jgi:hypothetical protein
MPSKPKAKKRLGLNDQRVIDEKIKDGWSKNKIAIHIGCSYQQVLSYLSRKNVEYEDELPVKIRRLLQDKDNFGKFNEETQEYIVELYREDIPSNFIADLLGLNYSPSKINTDGAGFSEKPELTFKNECKQAQAEATIKTIMIARAGQKSAEAMKFLEKSEATRQLYKAPKEEKGKIQIEFPGFSRALESSASPEIKEEDEEDLKKLLN